LPQPKINDTLKTEVNMTILEELEYKRKAALIVVCTLGLDATPFKLHAERNIFRGTLLDNGALSFLLKILSFLLLTIPFAIVMFFLFLFKLVYYQIEISKLTR
jgi:hypothetical protein